MTMIDPWLVAGNALVSVIITVITLIIATKYAIAPYLNTYLEEKTQEATQALSSGMKALSNKGVESREIKRMEKGIADNVLEQYPEIMILLEQFDPDTADMIRKYPTRALTMINRYANLFGLVKQTRQDVEYDLG